MCFFVVLQFIQNTKLAEENNFHYEDNLRLLQENQELKERFRTISEKTAAYIKPIHDLDVEE